MASDLEQQIDEQILNYYIEIDSKGRFVHPPKNDDELHEFIRIALNINVPRKKVELHHKAPFEFVSDLFFERVKNAIGFASRNSGKTVSLAVINFLDMFFKQNCEVASAGAILDQANKCYRYFASFLDLPWFEKFCKHYNEVTGKKFLIKTIQSRTDFANGSSMEILTGTEKGLRSPHPHKARLDEIDLMEWGLIQTGLSMARSDNSIRGQNVFTSTRQYEAGTMQRLLDESESKGISVYEWNVWETVERCKRRCKDDPKFGTCPIYTFCQGKAHHCDGFYKIDDFIDKVRVLDRERFETEWLNARPSKNKLVYHMFDNTKHIMTPKKLWEMFRVNAPQSTWSRVSGIDFGSSPGHPFVYLKFVKLPNNAWLAYYEYVANQRLLRDHAQAIKSSPFWLRSERIYADHDLQDRIELKELGVYTYPAEKDVNMGCDYLASLLRGFPPKEEPQLYVWYECKNLITGLGRYSWPVRPDGKIDRSGNPEKRYDDEVDCARYALYSHRGSSKSKYQTFSAPGI